MGAESQETAIRQAALILHTLPSRERILASLSFPLLQSMSDGEAVGGAEALDVAGTPGGRQGRQQVQVPKVAL